MMEYPDSYALISEMYLVDNIKQTPDVTAILYLIRREKKPLPLLWHDFRYVFMPYYVKRLAIIKQSMQTGVLHLGSRERT